MRRKMKWIKNKRVLPAPFVKKNKLSLRGWRPKQSPLVDCFVALLLAMTVAIPSFAQSTTVPRLLNFQSVVTDVGGAPLADGMHAVRFRLLNAAQEPLYEETQSVESASGVVSAMIGASNEIPLSVFVPGEPRFLGVEVEGAGPERVMEIVSTPYSLYAEQALSVAPKSVGKEALADDILEGLAPVFLTEAGASQIGVETDFVYSRGSTVQATLKDFDTALHQRQFNIEREATARLGADTALNKNISDEATARSSADTVLNKNISDEATARSIADANLQTQVNSKLAASGGAMSGVLNMGLNKIANVAGPVSPTDAATRGYVDTKVDGVNANVAANQASLAAMPKIVAWGIVNANGGGTPQVDGSYNIASVTRFEDVFPRGSHSYRVAFSNSVSMPYVIIGNAFNTNDKDGGSMYGDTDSMVTIVAEARGNGDFVLRTINGADGGGANYNDVSFNFAVIK